MNSAHLNAAQWHPVCRLDDLVANSGVVAWLDAQPAALFWLPDQEPAIYALAHYDPLGKAEVLAHGLVCESQGEWSVASPLYKQRYRLTDGQCLEEESIKVRTWPVRLVGAEVEVYY
ncbi:nitrite reductase (NADH) small subunit [Marinospirillum celere]|uniref:Nitrite reductase (NADH) small subunit n=1 Tax=Marinospirillum celere TaxID=1122252 RepID=A0A1I1G5A9_9GAMM|nr:nitrite reductase small subunit NirD [Marinospirillum celere]SFC06512.1 nitrite reductase (NADH) small subunit [Marinospirillum celere]